MLGNVKNQMTNWIGGGIASLRKTSEGDAFAVTEQTPDSPLLENSPKGSIKEKDDDDNSRFESSYQRGFSNFVVWLRINIYFTRFYICSATGGADSDLPISDEEDIGKEEGFAPAAGI